MNFPGIYGRRFKRIPTRTGNGPSVGWRAGLAHAMLALVVLALGRTWISRRAQTAEGIQTIARFNTPDTNNTDFWDQFVALEEQEETADAAKILMSAYLDLYQSLQSEESGRNKAVLQDQMTALTTALSRRIEKTTTTRKGLLNAWADMMQEFPGYYDVLYKMISESDLGKAGLDQSAESLAVKVYEMLLKRMKAAIKELAGKTSSRESGELDRVASDEEDGESEEEQEQRRQNRITRRHLLAGLIAAKALRDADSQEARDVLQKAVLANENKLLKETKEIEKQRMSGFTNGDQLWRGLKREDVGFEKFSDAVSSRGLSSLRDLANGGSFDVNRYMRLVVMQARIALGQVQMDEDDGASLTSDGENETDDKAMMGGARKDRPRSSWRTRIARTMIALMGFQALPPVPSGAFARDLSRSPRPALVPDNQNWSLDQRLRYSRDDQYSAQQIYQILEQVQAHPDVIPSRIGALPGIIRAVGDNPETALAAHQLIGTIRSHLDAGAQGQLDAAIFGALTPYIGHSNRNAADLARSFLVLSRVGDMKGRLLALMGNDPHRVAATVEILGYRHEAIEEIYKIGKDSKTPMIYESCFHALALASGKKLFLTSRERDAGIGILRGFGRLPENAFERIDIETGWKGNDKDREYWSIGGRGWTLEFENRLYEVERDVVTSDTTFVFGQPIVVTDTTTVKEQYRKWEQTRGTAVRLDLARGMFRFLMDVFSSPFKNHAQNYIISIINSTADPQKKIAGIRVLSQIDSEDSVKNLLFLLRDQNKTVANAALDGLRFNSNQESVRKQLPESYHKMNPGFMRRLANTVFKTMFQAFGLYSNREWMGLNTDAPLADIYKGLGAAGDLLELTSNRAGFPEAALRTGAEYVLADKIAGLMKTVSTPFSIVASLFGAEIGNKMRQDEIKKLAQDPDPTFAYQCMSFLFAGADQQEFIPVLLAMFGSRDPIVRTFARDGLKRLKYQFDVNRIQSDYLSSGDLEKQAIGTAWLGAAGTREAVSVLESAYHASQTAAFKAEVITALADIVRDGDAGTEAGQALMKIGQELEGREDDVSQGLRLHFGHQVRNFQKDGAGALGRMSRRFSGEAGGSLSGQTRIFDSRAQQVADQKAREDRARQPFYAGGIKMDPKNPGPQDVGQAASVFESSLESSGVMGLRQQLRLLEYFDGLAVHGQLAGKNRERVIDLCRSAMDKGSLEVQMRAGKLWTRLSPQTFKQSYPAESYRVPDYSREFLLTVQLWNARRQFLNEDGNAVDFDRLVDKARRSGTLPYDLMWAAKKGWDYLDLQIEAIAAIASLDTPDAQNFLIQVAEDKNSALSGYAVAVLLERNSSSKDPGTLNRIGAAIAVAIKHDYWPVRQQVLQELMVYAADLNRRLQDISRGNAVGLSSEELIDGPHGLRMQLQAFDIIMRKALEDAISPDSEGIKVIRQFAARVKAALENSQGIRPGDLVMNNRDLGRVNFDDPSHDPRLMIAREQARQLTRDMVAQIYLSSAVLYPKDFGSVTAASNDPGLSAAERALGAQAFSVTGPLTEEQRHAMLQGLVEESPRVLKVKIQTALSQGIRAEAIKEKFLFIIHHPAQFSAENRVSASFGLAQLMEKGDIVSNDLQVYFAFNELRKDDDSEVRIQGLRGLLKMSLTNEALNLMTPEQKRILAADLNRMLGQGRVEDEVVVDGRPRFIEEVTLEPLLPFKLVKDLGNKPSLKVIQSGAVFLLTRLEALDAADHRAQRNAFAHIRSGLPEERKMGYEMLRDLVKFARPQYFDITRIILTLIQSANTEEQQEARMELAQTLGNGSFKTNLNALTSGLPDQDLIHFYVGLFGALNRASESEWENYIKILDLKVLDDFDGRPHLPSSRADLYLRILDNPRRMSVLRDAGHLETIRQTIDRDLGALSGLTSGHAPMSVRIYWTQRLKELQERRARVWNGNDAQQKRQKVREYLQGRPLGAVEFMLPAERTARLEPMTPVSAGMSGPQDLMGLFGIFPLVFGMLMPGWRPRRKIKAFNDRSADGLPEISQSHFKTAPVAARMDPVQSPDAAEIRKPDQTGGIDLRPAGFETQILRDDRGTPLPLPQQPPELLMKIEGFIPVIIQQMPVSVPQMLGLKDMAPGGAEMVRAPEDAGSGEDPLPWSRRQGAQAEEAKPRAYLNRHPADEDVVSAG